jgi:putative intracellular protease/amidase
MKILMVLTSHSELGSSGTSTGFWLDEFAAPYFLFKDAGAQVRIASPLGGEPPMDPKSDEPAAQTDATRRFKADPAARAALAGTLRLRGVSASDFDAVFYPGGHGPMWDLAENGYSIALIEAMLAADKPVAAVCHGPAALRHVKTPDGYPAVRGRTVTGFSNTEERASGLGHVVPYLLEDMLRQSGADYSRVPDWKPHVVTDGLLITGQNPASAAPAAKALLQKISQTVPT